MFVHPQTEHFLDGSTNTTPPALELSSQPLDPDSIAIGAHVLVRQVVEVAYTPDGNIISPLQGQDLDMKLSTVHMLRTVQGIVTARPADDGEQSTFHIQPSEGGPTAVVPGPQTPHWVDQKIGSHTPGVPGPSITGVFPANYKFYPLSDEQVA